MPESSDDNDNRRFDPRRLQSTVIALPLFGLMEDHPEDPQRVLITLHSGFGDPGLAANKVRRIVKSILAHSNQKDQTLLDDLRLAQYVVANLTPDSIRALVKADRDQPPQAIYQIWPDFEVNALVNRSVATVKADAARVSFAAAGKGIVWAVVDSGIDKNHAHFKEHDTLALDRTLRHKDFTLGANAPTTDVYGHGTHVAGIIAGDSAGFRKLRPPRDAVAIRAMRDERNKTDYVQIPPDQFVGMAPQCKLVSYKVLDDKGRGDSTAIIAALQDIQKVNRYSHKLKIHGVNLSVGYPIDPTWFACGQSPVCVEVTSLVNSGVVVVVAAGNTGFGYNLDYVKGNVASGQGQTINDPGNTEAAITVGSTHRDMPHTYGVSYFSSKGPTGDGRAKPDLIAPGEKIVSCAAGSTRTDIQAKPDVPKAIDYVEDSGTSMAAAHVSGVIAAFLSVRREFIGRPADIKKIFTSTATDLGRVTDFQGHGLVDLMRAIQSV